MSKKRDRETRDSFSSRRADSYQAVNKSIKSFKELAAKLNEKPKARVKVSLARYAVALALVGGMLTGTAIVFAMHHVYSAPIAKRL